MVTALLRVILVALIVSISTGGTVSRSISYAVSLTTIPPRFNYVHNTIRSWLHQTVSPTKVVIFVPNRYKRFRKKVSSNDVTPYHEQLRASLMMNGVADDRVQVVAVDEDWGPITKFIGSMHHQAVLSNNGVFISHWLYSDDDVFYLPTLALQYQDALASLPSPVTDPRYHNVGYTMFATESRLQFQLTQEATPRHVSHIQGVDTYIIPSGALAELFQHGSSTPHATNTDGHMQGEPVLSRNSCSVAPRINITSIEQVVRHYHSTLCPESFYQDDYVVSLLLDLVGIRMISLRQSGAACCKAVRAAADHGGVGCGDDSWSLRHDQAVLDTADKSQSQECGCDMHESIPGVTKQRFQMHIKEEVFVRESITQRCLMDTANDAYRDLCSSILP
jgi:hypothetical protein